MHFFKKRPRIGSVKGAIQLVQAEGLRCALHLQYHREINFQCESYN